MGMSSRRVIGPSAWIVGAVGLLIGVVAVWLVTRGNPGNMGLCVACFTRDSMSVFGGSAAKMASFGYIRPEIWGLVLGAGLSAAVYKEWRARGGSAWLMRFVLGFIFIVAALVFLGCTVRAWLRLGAGDLNALVGVAGLFTGIAVGTWFLKRGFNLGRAKLVDGKAKAAGLLGAVVAVALLAVVIAYAAGVVFPSLTFVPKGAKSTAEGAVFNSEEVFKPAGASAQDGQIVAQDGAVVSDAESVGAAKGVPGGARAPLAVSLAAGALIGVAAQRSRFCTIGGIRDAILVRRWDLLFGVGGLLVGTFAASVALGTFKLGFQGQPAAHSDFAANFLAMTVAGLAAVQLGGCPLRQMVMSAEGDIDAFAAVLGMMAGAFFAHYFNIAATATGVTTNAWVALGVMGAVVLAIGIRKSRATA